MHCIKKKANEILDKMYNNINVSKQKNILLQLWIQNKWLNHLQRIYYKYTLSIFEVRCIGIIHEIFKNDFQIDIK